MHAIEEQACRSLFLSCVGVCARNESKQTVRRPIYAGNAIATVRHTAPGVVMLTVRTTAFEPAAMTDGAPAAIGEAGRLRSVSSV